MGRKLMCLEIHFRLEDVGLVGLAFGVQADKVLIGEVLLQLLVVQIVLRISASISPVANVAPFMLLSAVGVEFVISVESLFAETALRVTFEARLVDGTWVIVPKLLVFS
jgi:hypothetical protein